MKNKKFNKWASIFALVASPLCMASPAPGTLAWNMVKMDEVYDAFPRGLDQLSQPETKALKIAAISAWREYNTASRKLIPPGVTSPEAITRYEELFDQVNDQLTLLEAAVNNESSQRCSDIVQQIRALKKTGHREFK